MNIIETEISNIKEEISHDYILELQKKFSKINFERIEDTESQHNSKKKIKNNEIDKIKNIESDKIFIETRFKKTISAIHLPSHAKVLKRKFLYFSQNESKNKIYKFDAAKELKSKEKFVIQYIGHATVLIQVPGLNILTDPVFFSVDQLNYAEKTKSYPCIQHLPTIDIILISNNHCDHLDRNSLQELLEYYRKKLWIQPKVLVPMGDKKLLQKIGFHHIIELNWYSKVVIITPNKVCLNFVCIPADQQSESYQKSLVTGWIINPEQDDVIFKYSGDTKSLSSDIQLAIDAVLYNEITLKKINVNSANTTPQIPKIICFEPSGPNYTRCNLESNHQSTSYSALLKFIEANNLFKISGIPQESFLTKIKTIMFHHNKFQLGSDRFNEGVFIVKKLYNYLHLDDENLSKEYERQKQKLAENVDKEKLKRTLPFSSRQAINHLSGHTSILVRSKDFIIQDIINVQNELGMDNVKLRRLLMSYLIKNTVFFKIGERMTCLDLMSAVFNTDIEKYSGYTMQKDLNIKSIW